MDRAQDGTGLISTGSSVTEGSTAVEASEASGVMLPTFGSFCPNPGNQTARRPHNASWRRHFILLDGKRFGQLAYSSREMVLPVRSPLLLAQNRSPLVQLRHAECTGKTS